VFVPSSPAFSDLCAGAEVTFRIVLNGSFSGVLSCTIDGTALHAALTGMIQPPGSVIL